IKYVRRRWLFLFCGGALLGITVFLWRETAFRTVLYSLMDLTFPNNTVRYGSWQAGLNMAWAHPIVGVGIGQYGFYFSQHLPNWAMQIFGFSRFLNPLDYSTWVPAFSIHTRIFAETGIVGGILWLSIWFSTSTVLVLHMFSNNDGATGTRMVQAATLLASLVGLFISGFNNDSFRFLELSVTLAACWIFFRDCDNSGNLLFKNVWSCLCQK
ncbi:MAG TPA: O-antigen ligase family protein, partial [Negativicutes bacterium]|nr:O-antigen ligase family protein [Negativicutes bacterium]